MSERIGKVTPELARQLKHQSEELDRNGGGIPHEEVRARWLSRMGRELRELIAAYDGQDDHKAKELLDALVVAKEEGVPDLDDIMHALALKMGKQSAA
jgi:hypothetical protein